MNAEITVRDNPDSHTYDAMIDGEVVGMITYEPRGSRLIVSHTIIDPAHRGQGIGNELVRQALDDIEARGMTISNYCSFITEYIHQHPERAGLIDTAHPGTPQHD